MRRIRKFYPLRTCDTIEFDDSEDFEVLLSHLKREQTTPTHQQNILPFKTRNGVGDTDDPSLISWLKGIKFCAPVIAKRKPRHANSEPEQLRDMQALVTYDAPN